MISLKNPIGTENHLSLKGVLRIGGQRNFIFPLGNEEHILVCSRFWDQRSLEVFVSEDGVNLLEIFTITNDHNFLEKMRNNFLKLEMLKVNKEPKNDAIGLLHLPLHQFFIAYRDVTITNRLCEEQFPVFSTDAWVPVLNLITGAKAGEVECLLAIGTDRQIENIKRSRKWKTNDKILQTDNFTPDNIGSDFTRVESEQMPPKTNKTLDLLNMLQKSIATPSSTINLFQTAEQLADRKSLAESFRVYLEIKSARGLPLNPSLKMKKQIKRNTSGKGRHIRFPSDEPPSTYVTFQADEGNGTRVKSHEGMVYSTDIIEKTSNPMWSKSFCISVSFDYLINKNRRFILKIWRKNTMSCANTRPLPCPMEDSIIGFVAIDFTTFHANTPFISSWFNIVDFSGHINGQIKVTAQPMDDMQKLVDLVRQRRDYQVDHLLDSFESSLNINNMSLSRAIKRKFTELEEISDRLRARLLDVTGDTELEADIPAINDEQLDQFEHDLNTIACEDENDNISSETNCTPSSSHT